MQQERDLEEFKRKELEREENTWKSSEALEKLAENNKAFLERK